MTQSSDVVTDKSDEVVFENNIYFTKYRRRFKRSYQKIVDVLSSLGGLFSISYYAGRMIYHFYVEVHLQFYFYQHLLKFQVEKTAGYLQWLEKKKIN